MLGHYMLTLLRNSYNRVPKSQSLIRIVQKPCKPTFHSPAEGDKPSTTGHCSPKMQRDSVHFGYPPVMAAPTSHKSQSATRWPL